MSQDYYYEILSASHRESVVKRALRSLEEANLGPWANDIVRQNTELDYLLQVADSLDNTPYDLEELIKSNMLGDGTFQFPVCDQDDIKRVQKMIAEDPKFVTTIMTTLLKVSWRDIYECMRENQEVLAALFNFDPELIEQAERAGPN